MVTVKKFVFNPFQENTYVLYDETKECIIVDPGCYQPHEKQELVDFIVNNELKPVKLVSTHSHIDHILGNKFVVTHFGISLHINKEDLETLERVPTYAGAYGFSDFEVSPSPTSYFDLEKGLSFGTSKLDIIFVPGHSPGHVVFYSEQDKFVINGDCLFYGSIGRTDLPGGDHELLLKSIKTKLFTLPDDTLVYCGHGPETNIGFEKMNNPFLR